jgi:predicted acetyltransferase
MEEEPRFLKRNEWKSLVKLLNHAFPNDIPFDKTWPHTTLIKCKDDLKGHLVIKDKGRVVSHVGIFPLKAVIGDSVINIAGIGGVSTYKSYRGRGFMKMLLNRSIEIMKKEKYDISWLGGDRRRYGNFGWENGGAVYKFFITERSIKDICTEEFEVKEYNGGKEYLNQIKVIHEKEYLRIRRTNEMYKILFSRMYKETYLAYKDGKVISYITIQKNKENPALATAYEYGGDISGFKYLLKYLFTNLKIERLDISSPFNYTEYKDLLFKCSSSWNINCSGMIKIINLKSLLKKFENQMSMKIKDLGVINKRKITLVISDNNEFATLQIGNSIKVTDKESNNKLVLNERDMVKLLFGLSKPSNEFNLSKEFLVLDVVFPLDFYIWPLEVI